MSVLKNGPMPMYSQIAVALKQEIENNRILPGDSIGSQRELQERFSVSQITVRQAIDLLEEEGLVVRKQGKGTFVKPVKLEQNLVSLQSLSEIIKESGYKPSITILKMELIRVPLNLKNFYSNIEKCLFLERLHVIQDKPIAFAKIFLPPEIKDKFTIQDFENNTIYDLYEKKMKTELGEALQVIEACKADDKLAECLQVNVGDPLLKAERMVYSSDNKPLEHITFYYRYDEYTFKIKLKRARETSMWP